MRLLLQGSRIARSIREVIDLPDTWMHWCQEQTKQNAIDERSVIDRLYMKNNRSEP